MEFARVRACWQVEEKDRSEGMGKVLRIWFRISVGRVRSFGIVKIFREMDWLTKGQDERKRTTGATFILCTCEPRDKIMPHLYIHLPRRNSATQIRR